MENQWTIGVCRRRVRRVLRRVVALALLLTACSSGHRVPTAQVRPAPPTTADPYAVPAVIDIAYVNRVLAALDQVDGDATREAVVR